MTDVQQLLAEYSRTGSEAAFQTLVARYINFVYSTALRLVGGNTHTAQDVTQMVFVGLAGKARTLSNDVALGGWLHQYTYHVATREIRTERRRQTREQEALAMNYPHDDSNSTEQLVSPILDEAITCLGHHDRTAILLRFFEQRDFRSVGEAMGINEDAARMRVSRALEKLHGLLKRRGLTLTVAALGTFLTAGAVIAAPAGMAVTVSQLAWTGAAAGKGSLLTSTTKIMMLQTKLKLGVAAVAIIGATATIMVQHQSTTRLRATNESIRQQLTQLASDNENLSNQLVNANQLDNVRKPASLSQDQLNELLKLRGEIGVFRRQNSELAKFRQESQGLQSTMASGPTNSDQLSDEDRFTLQQTHAVSAINNLLEALESYSTNHGGAYPDNLDQLNLAGDLKSLDLGGDLSLKDFEILTNPYTDPQGSKYIVGTRTPMPRPGRPSVIVYGGFDDQGRPRTEILNGD